MKILATLLSIFVYVHICCAQQQVAERDTIFIDDFDVSTIELPKKLNEISALAYEDRDKSVVSFWGLNDSGNLPELYRFSQNGEILQTIKITNAPNIDWEEIALSNDKLFFADFGNNLGKRTDLAIYYIDRNQINLNTPELSLEAKKIEFYFPEQTTFGFKNLTTNWDTEAFFIYNNQIHLLTKEWTNKATTHYSIPIDTTKKHAAKKLETFPTNYLVTGVHISLSPKTKGLYLIGYTLETLAVMQWFNLPENNSDLIFTDSKKSITLPLGFTTQWGQLEGISLSSPEQNQICISGEEFKFKQYHAKQALHCFKNFTN